MKVRVTADSTCDLSTELKERYDIAIAPLTVLLGDDAYHDGMDPGTDRCGGGGGQDLQNRSGEYV